ncbi:MAG: dual specificity protein phosphatase [Chloroflexota bacterium]|nr:dual specificity protein phosphatase [Chloroflexota bacterium]
MKAEVYVIHQRLETHPLIKALYILYCRLREDGLHITGLWLRDKILRNIQGVSPQSLSQITPRLYVGGQQRKHGLPRLEARGIQAVVNLRGESDDAARGVAPEHYLWLPTTDDAPPTVEKLARAATFITAQIAAGRGVYIHCAVGVGRAPTTAAAYLVSTGVSPAEAWAAIRRGRPFIRPTPPQIEIVSSFAQYLATEKE